MGKKKKKRSLVKGLLLLIVLALPLLIWLGFGKRGIVNLYKMDLEKQKYMDRISELKKENKELMEEIRRLKKDPAYVEKVARQELGLIRQNEVIYRFENLQEKGDKRAQVTGGKAIHDIRQ